MPLLQTTWLFLFCLKRHYSNHQHNAAKYKQEDLCRGQVFVPGTFFYAQRLSAHGALLIRLRHHCTAIRACSGWFCF